MSHQFNQSALYGPMYLYPSYGRSEYYSLESLYPDFDRTYDYDAGLGMYYQHGVFSTYRPY